MGIFAYFFIGSLPTAETTANPSPNKRDRRQITKETIHFLKKKL